MKKHLLVISLFSIMALTSCEGFFDTKPGTAQKDDHKEDGDKTDDGNTPAGEDEGGQHGDAGGESGDHGDNPGGGDYDPEGGDDNPGGEDHPGGDDNPGGDDLGEAYKLSITVAELADAYGWANATAYKTVALDTVVTLTAEGGTNTGKYYTNGNDYRLYKTEGATITFSLSEGHSLKSIKLTYSKQNNGALEGLPSGQAKDFSGTTASFAMEGDSNAQVRITAFEIEYYGEPGVKPEKVVPTTWDEDSQELIDTYLYGVEIPYYYVEENEMEYDDDYEALYYYGGESSPEILTAYADLFDKAGWDLVAGDPEYYQYVFEKHFETSVGDRWIQAQLYAVDWFWVSEDGTGTFMLGISDPYYYSWEQEIVDYISGTLLGSKAEVPAPDVDASHYGIYQSSDDDAELACYTFDCYDVDADPSESYATALADWTEVEPDGDYRHFIAPTKDLSLYFAYSAEDEFFTIDLEKYLNEYDEMPLDYIHAVMGEEFTPVILEAKEGAYFTQNMISEEDDDGNVSSRVEVKAFGYTEDEYNTYLDLINGTEGWTVENKTEEVFDYDAYFAAYAEDPDVDYLDFYFDLVYQAIYYTVTDSEDNNTVYAYTMSYSDEYILMNFDGYKQQSTNSAEFPMEACLTWFNGIGGFSGITADNLPTLEAPNSSFAYEARDVEGDYVRTFAFTAEGNFEEAWYQAAAAKGFVDADGEPDEDYGYECVNETLGIELDIMYYNGVTYGNYYNIADFSY